MENEKTLFDGITIKVETRNSMNHDPLMFRAYAYKTETESYIDSYVALTKNMAIDGLFRELAELAKEI